MYISICLLFLSQYFCTSLSYTSYTLHNSHNVLSSHLQLIYNTISIKYTYGALALKYKLSRWRTHMGFWLGIPKRNMGLNLWDSIYNIRVCIYGLNNTKTRHTEIENSFICLQRRYSEISKLKSIPSPERIRCLYSVYCMHKCRWAQRFESHPQIRIDILMYYCIKFTWNKEKVPSITKRNLLFLAHIRIHIQHIYKVYKQHAVRKLADNIPQATLQQHL